MPIAGSLFLSKGAIQQGDWSKKRQGVQGPYLWKIVKIRLHLVHFEGSMIWKQAAKSELKKRDITQTAEFQKWIFLGPETILHLCSFRE